MGLGRESEHERLLPKIRTSKLIGRLRNKMKWSLFRAPKCILQQVMFVEMGLILSLENSIMDYNERECCKM